MSAHLCNWTALDLIVLVCGVFSCGALFGLLAAAYLRRSS